MWRYAATGGASDGSFKICESRLTQPSFERTLLAGGLLDADQRGQNLQHRAALAGRLIQHLTVRFGNFQKLQFGQVAIQPR